MSGETYGLTKGDVSKMSTKESKAHGGDVPAGSQAAGVQSIVDAAQKDKPSIIAERQANLPLPDDPPNVVNDFNSADHRTVNVGSGVRQDDISAGGEAESTLRSPATAGSAVREDADENLKHTAGLNVGRSAVEEGEGLPNDAVARGKRENKGLEETRN